MAFREWTASKTDIIIEASTIIVKHCKDSVIVIS